MIPTYLVCFGKNIPAADESSLAQCHICKENFSRTEVSEDFGSDEHALKFITDVYISSSVYVL